MKKLPKSSFFKPKKRIKILVYLYLVYFVQIWKCVPQHGVIPQIQSLEIITYPRCDSVTVCFFSTFNMRTKNKIPLRDTEGIRIFLDLHFFVLLSCCYVLGSSCVFHCLFFRVFSCSFLHLRITCTTNHVGQYKWINMTRRYYQLVKNDSKLSQNAGVIWFLSMQIRPRSLALCAG